MVLPRARGVLPSAQKQQRRRRFKINSNRRGRYFRRNFSHARTSGKSHEIILIYQQFFIWEFYGFKNQSRQYVIYHGTSSKLFYGW